jgi:hypothetical protein
VERRVEVRWLGLQIVIIGFYSREGVI